MAEPSTETQPKKKFAPKVPVKLQPPKHDPITPTALSQCDGTPPSQQVYVAIKGTVFDVSGNTAYAPGGGYHVFAGKDASRALAKTSLKVEDCIAVWEDLDDKEKGCLDDWYSFFEQRYNIVGRVEG